MLSFINHSVPSCINEIFSKRHSPGSSLTARSSFNSGDIYFHQLCQCWLVQVLLSLAEITILVPQPSCHSCYVIISLSSGQFKDLVSESFLYRFPNSHWSFAKLVAVELAVTALFPPKSPVWLLGVSFDGHRCCWFISLRNHALLFVCSYVQNCLFCSFLVGITFSPPKLSTLLYDNTML